MTNNGGIMVEAVDSCSSETFVCGVDEEFERAGKFDREADRQLEACFASTNFENQTLTYSHDFQSYEVRIIHNPDHAKIKVGSFTLSSAFMIISKDDLPEEVMDHLEQLGESFHGKDAGRYISNNSTTCMGLNCNPDFDVYATVKPEAPPQHSAPVFLGPPVQNPFDPQADQKIRTCFASDQFVNRVFTYNYEGETYTIRIVHNPDDRTLVADNQYVSYDWNYGIIPDKFLPDALMSHIFDLARTRWDYNAKAFYSDYLLTSCEGGLIASIAAYSMVRPHRVHTKGEFDTELDEKIREVFKSVNFVNLTFSYNYEGIDYTVRIIHNPDRATVRISELYYSMEWSDKYGIMSLKEMPWALEKHLTRLINNLSWWDYFFNLTSSNGSIVGFYGPWFINDTLYTAFTGAKPAKP